jgi:hypothetical protein
MTLPKAGPFGTVSVVRSPEDWAALVGHSTRGEFLDRHPHLFLVGVPTLEVPRAPSKTVQIHAPALRSLATLPEDVPELREPTRLILPILKSQDLFPEMITVGRTSNHDVVLRDITVSKFHAWFKEEGGRWVVVDAGSRNGTRVDGRALSAREPAKVGPGSRVVFGSVELGVHDAGSAWDLVRRW